MRLRWWAVLAVVGIAVGTYELWQLQAIRNELRVALESHDDDNVIMPEVGTIQFLKRNGFTIELSAANYTSLPSTGPLLKSGDRAPGSVAGIHLKGFVGNPTNLLVSNLWLKFSAIKVYNDIRSLPPPGKHDSVLMPNTSPPMLTLSAASLPWPKSEVDAHANDELFNFGPEAVGQGGSIGIEELSPGGKQPFEITFLRLGFSSEDMSLQADGIRFTVFLSGERYSPTFIP